MLSVEKGVGCQNGVILGGRIIYGDCERVDAVKFEHPG